MSSQEIYARAPLVAERREIRILALAPGTGDDALRGDLFVDSLNYDDLHYIALSYTWSGPPEGNIIIIGGLPLRITKNLELALRRIRGPSRPKNLWVDAICINQNDIEEKSVQVSLMGDIYASATRTTVWLGEKSSQSDVAMDFIRSLRGDSHSYDSDADQVLTLAIAELLGRQWWTRVWVIQEALLSRHVILMCGDREVNLVYFIQLVQGKGFRNAFLTENGAEEPQRLAKRSSQDMAPKKDCEHPKQLSGQSFIEILTIWYIYKQQAETSGLNLMDLTLLTHSFKASVQRDKIFALLGLATPEARLWIIPDYSDVMSDSLLLTRITAYFLQFSSQPLRIAAYCPATNCPSWVPDWTAIDSEVIKAMRNDDREHGYDNPSPSYEWLSSPDSPTAKFNPRLEPPFQELERYQEPSTLLVHGFIVDKVQIAIQIPSALDTTGHYSSAAAPSIKAKFREWESLMFKWQSSERQRMTIDLSSQEVAQSNRKLKASIIKHLAGHLNCGTMEYAVWSVEFAHLYELDDEDRELIDGYEEWMLSPGQDICDSCINKNSSPCSDCSRCNLPRGPKELGLKIISRNAGKTLFLTELGNHFVRECAVKEGDVICALKHTFPFFILRRVGDEYWTLVGHHQNEGDFWVKFEWYFKESVTASKNEVFILK